MAKLLIGQIFYLSPSRIYPWPSMFLIYINDISKNVKLLPPPHVKNARIMLETSNLARKYTHMQFPKI